MWSRILPYYHPYRGEVALGLAAVLISSALSGVLPALLKRGIDSLRDGAPRDDLLRLGGLMLAIAAVAGVLRFTMRKTLNGVSRRIETDLRHDLLARLTTLDASWYTAWRTGDLMARLTNDLGAVRMAVGPALMYFTNTIVGGLIALAMMLQISPSLTLAALLPMVGLPFLMLRLGKRVHDQFERAQEQFSQLTTRAQENLAGVRVVRAYRQEEAEQVRFAALGERYLDANIAVAKLNGIMNPGFSLLAGLGSAITLALGGRQLIEGRLTVGSFVAFSIYLGMLTWPLIALGWTTNLFQRGTASMGRLLVILDAAPQSVMDTGITAIPDRRLLTTRGPRLEFRDVSFRYPGTPADRWVLRQLSFTVEPGSTTAIVGATGSGKSALMDLITRSFDPQEGVILLDGIDIRTMPLAALRREIGAVPQEALLFSETVGDNIAYGQSSPDTGLRDEAARIAQLMETIERLPAGYDTRLGERGINLSGGQKQRAAIARALARDPGVVLLDDALSAVDTHTEAAILHGLRDALAGRTSLIASHRVSAVREADQIIVLDDGRIVESGSHDALLAQGGRYATLLQRQQLLDAIEAA